MSAPDSFLRWALDLIAARAEGDDDAPVFLRPQEEALRVGAGESALVWDLPREGTPDEELRAGVEDLLARHMANGRTPRFMNQLFSGVSDPGMAATLLGIHQNNTLSTREAAPLPTAMERAVIGWMLAQLPWDAGQGAGSVTPGGSFSNYLAVYLARRRATARLGPEAVPRLALFTSSAAHYSIPKGADLAGINPAAVFEVPADDGDHLHPGALRSAIERAKSQGLEPFFVNATLGTTVVGALDPVADLAGEIRGENLWLHVDAAWGALGLLGSDRERFARGLEHADSVTWDAHKGGGAPVAVSFLLTRDGAALDALHPRHRGGYLFHDPDAPPQEADLGLTSLYCGKPFLSLAPWVVWKSRGLTGMRAAVDRAWALTLRFRDRIAASERFELALEPESWSVAFRPLAPADAAHEVRDALARETRARFNAPGRWMMNVCPHPGGAVLRALFVNPLLTESHVDELADHLEAVAASVGGADVRTAADGR
jgi:glutamate/tyrosine decarboxylase-like PLP-dependent enzyme